VPDQSYTYLLIDLASIALPLAFSFERRIWFIGQWKYWSIAILVPAIFFITWDIIFTNWGIWGFNSRYLTGVFILGLPIEECLFFFCIPYACLFTYEALKYLIPKKFHPYGITKVTVMLVGFLGILFCFNLNKAYTSTTFMLLLTTLVVHQWWIKSDYLGRFYFTYIFILIPFFMVNGVLTGSFIEEPVVWYNERENLGSRLFTIPVEDVFYGMLLILLNVTVFETLKKRICW
jgi:lycopene cyclase domain-containing protein